MINDLPLLIGSSIAIGILAVILLEKPDPIKIEEYCYRNILYVKFPKTEWKEFRDINGKLVECK